MDKLKLRKLDEEYAAKIADCQFNHDALEIIYQLLVQLECYSTARELDALTSREKF